MLFTDSSTITPKDLSDHETVVLDTAHTEEINLTIKILLARDEVGLQLLSKFPELGLVNVELNNVVVTPALRLWLVFHTLEIVYRDAYHNQLNDRYKAKWQEYTNLSLFASDLLFKIGIGTVIDPLAQTEHPTLSLVPGAILPAKYFVQVAWRNSGGDEGGPSEMTALEVTTGNTLRVQAVNAPAGAVKWNVYSGATPETLFLQNPTPLDPSASWTAPDEGLFTSGPRPGNGQQPTFLSPAPRILLRG